MGPPIMHARQCSFMWLNSEGPNLSNRSLEIGLTGGSGRSVGTGSGSFGIVLGGSAMGSAPSGVFWGGAGMSLTQRGIGGNKGGGIGGKGRGAGGARGIGAGGRATVLSSAGGGNVERCGEVETVGSSTGS